MERDKSEKNFHFSFCKKSNTIYLSIFLLEDKFPKSIIKAYAKIRKNQPIQILHDKFHDFY